jgi:phosphatidylserine decarboxylase
VLTTRAIRWFIKRYGVNMQEAVHTDPASYACFNDFFTRALRPELRPLGSATWLSPVDGAVSQLGRIEKGSILQAKGHYYSPAALLACSEDEAQTFHQGHFACLYLSPKDYHRIHMPCAGTLRKMVYVPGSLFSVNPTTAQGVAGLFARNERVVCHFDTEHGEMVMVLVGATIVGSVATTWHGVVHPPRSKTIETWHYPQEQNENPIHLAQGEEMGRFLLGSTVILLWPEVNLQFSPQWQPEATVRMGQDMATTSF